MKPKVLLVGYNGANNTGAEAKLLVIIDEIRSVLGPEACITIPSLNVENLRRYLQEGSNLKIIPVRPSMFFFDIKKFVKENDLIMLVEGSTYMDTWGSVLLWYYLLATRYAHSMKKPCIGYAVDAGSASALNRRLIRHEASKTDLILPRSVEAATRLKKWEVTAPIEVTADNAFAFRPNPADEGLLRKVWPEASHVVGFAAEDIYKWPVVIRPWGRRIYCYRWPYYYTHTHASLEKGDRLAEVLAAQADRIIKEHDKDIALLGMEGLDSAFINKVRALMKLPERTRVFTAFDYNASQMTCILRGLDLLITSRFHAGVLSLESQIPQTAIGHDMRIKDLYTDLGMPDLFVDHEAADRFEALTKNIDTLLSQGDRIKDKLRKGYEQYQKHEKRNPELLRAFLEARYPEWLK